MKEEFGVLMFYSFLVATSGLSYSMLDKHTQRTADGIYHGRYTRDIHNPELLIPRRVTEDGSFVAFTLPNFYDRQELEARKKRTADANANTDADANTVDDDLADHRVHLVLPFNGADHHVELTPHHEFISPDLVVETRGEGAVTDLNNGVRFKRLPDLQCHYRGHIRGHDDSKAALSLCEGVAGYVQTDQGRYFIEPLEEAVADEEGQHVHMVYKRTAPHEKMHDDQRETRTCGTSDNWEEAWAEQIEKRNRQQRFLADNGTFVKRAPQNSATHSIHRYIEIALVCDKRFLDYHKGKDYEQYLLTIMNMAADYYHDGSSGNQLDVIVVRIVYLEKEKEEIDLLISPQAEKTLESFAAWANKMNPTDTAHPNHHDVAVLVTRYDICSTDADQPCGLLGLAYVAAACNPTQAACINEDTGLVLGLVITHEVGHTLGCSHDTPEISGCEPQDKDGSYYVMSPYGNIFTLRWSTCSRKFLTSFLETGIGECLSDNKKRPNEKYKFPGMLPGAMYDGKWQCDATFPGSTLCERGEEVCQKLWCTTKESPKTCTSREPPAEGTKCAENKWCIHHQCVEMGKRPSAVHGGWGSWGGMGECSRTCGGGIRSSERECDNPTPKDGGRYCLGERKRFSTCNTAPCDETKPSYRAVQCSEFDSKTVLSDGVLHKWRPHTLPKENPCILFCLNEKNVYVQLAPTVKDGTPCEAGTRNMCISGTCRTIGCDWGLDSDAMDDQCGICRGDGTQCTPVEGDYTVTGKRNYEKIVTVPRGSRNIRLTEKAPAKNTLAIKLEKGDKYILNGNTRENKDGEYPCAGSIAIYNHPEPMKEDVFIRGPIEEEIQLQYAFYEPQTNPGVHYIYYVRSGKSGSTPQYLWDFLDWGPCSAKCGGGTQLAQAACVEHLSGRVGNSFCKDIKRPAPKSRVCDSATCGAKWRVSQWSRCSACGGKKGQQKRKVQCIKPAARSGGEDVQAELKACKGKAPVQSQDCTGSNKCKKKCTKKKTRSNVFGERSNAYDDQRPSPEEQQRIIDKLVDVGLTRYLEKPNFEHTAGKSKKRNVAPDFENLIDDWAAPSNEVDLDSKRDCPGALAKGFAMTPKPGSVVKDPVPDSDMVILEAPYINAIPQSNLSDQAFQEDGDVVGVELDTSKMKIYKGADATKRLEEAQHHNNGTLPRSAAEE